MKTLEEIRASARIRRKKYYENHKKECLARGYAWRLKNLDKFNKSQRKHYLKKRDIYLKKAKERSRARLSNPKEIKKMRLARTKHHRLNSHKDNARMFVHYAVKTGFLKKPKNCFKCLVRKIEAHHENYLNPLEVVWLCKKHHHLRHREINDKNKSNLIG